MTERQGREPTTAAGSTSFFKTLIEKNPVVSTLIPALTWPPLLALLVISAAWYPIAQDARIGPVFQHTSSILLGVALRALPLGCLIAALLCAVKIPFRRSAVALLAAWGALPIGLVTVAWKAVWQQPGSYLDRLCGMVGGSIWPSWFGFSETLATPTRSPALDGSEVWMRGEAAVIWIHTVSATPWVAAIFALAWSTRPRGLEAARALEPRGAAQGSSLHGAYVALALAFVAWGVIGEIAAADVFAVRTYAEEVYLGFPLGGTVSAEGPTPDPNALADYRFPLSSHLLAMTGTCVATYLLLTWSSRLLRHCQWEPREPRDRAGFNVLAAALLSVILVFFLGVPLVDLIRQAGTETVRVATADSASVSIERVWSNATFWERMRETPWRLRHEMGASLAIVASATMLSWLAAHALIALAKTRIGMGVVIAILAIAIGVPAPVWGVLALEGRSLGGSWTAAIADRSLTLPVTLLTIRLVPLAAFGVALSSARVSQRLRDAVQLEPWNRWQRWWRLDVALSRRWQAGILLALALSGLNDVAATSLVLPPGVDSLARRLLGMVHAGVDEQVAAMTLWNITLAGTFGAAAVLLGMRGSSSRVDRLG